MTHPLPMILIGALAILIMFVIRRRRRGATSAWNAVNTGRPGWRHYDSRNLQQRFNDEVRDANRSRQEISV